MDVKKIMKRKGNTGEEGEREILKGGGQKEEENKPYIHISHVISCINQTVIISKETELPPS